MTKLASWTLSVPGIGDAHTYTYELNEAGGFAIVGLGNDGATAYDIILVGEGKIAIMDPSLGWYWNPRGADTLVLWQSGNWDPADTILPPESLTLLNIGDGNIGLQCFYTQEYLKTSEDVQVALRGYAGGWYPNEFQYGTGSIGTVSSNSYGVFSVGGDQLPILIVTGSGYKLNLAGKDLSGVVIPEGADMREVNLQGANLSCVAIPTANFTGAKMQGVTMSVSPLADFTSADFTGTFLCNVFNWPNAQLNSAILIKANLAGVDMTGAKLAGAKLMGAILDNTTLNGADLTGAVLDGASMKGTKLKNVTAIGTSFNNCDLSTCEFGESPTFSRSTAVRTTFVGATVPYSALGNDWSFLDLRNAKITDIPQTVPSFVADYALLPSGSDPNSATAPQLDLSGRDLTGALFRYAQGANINFNATNLESAQFQNATLNGSDFRGSNLANASFNNAYLTVPTLTRKRLRDPDPPTPQACKFGSAFLINTDFTGAHCEGADFESALFIQSAADGAQTPVAPTHMTGANFSDAICLQVTFDNAYANGAQFVGATLIGSSFKGTQLLPDDANHVPAASLQGAKIQGLNARGAAMDGVNLLNAVCSVAKGEYNAQYTDFSGNPVFITINYSPTILGILSSDTTCPDGSFPTVDPDTGALACKLTAATTQTLTVQRLQGSPASRTDVKERT